jgi:hypothetical protein
VQLANHREMLGGRHRFPSLAHGPSAPLQDLLTTAGPHSS